MVDPGAGAFTEVEAVVSGACDEDGMGGAEAFPVSPVVLVAGAPGVLTGGSDMLGNGCLDRCTVLGLDGLIKSLGILHARIPIHQYIDKLKIFWEERWTTQEYLVFVGV